MRRVKYTAVQMLLRIEFLSFPGPGVNALLLSSRFVGLFLFTQGSPATKGWFVYMQFTLNVS